MLCWLFVTRIILPTGIYLAQNGHFRAYKKQLNQLGWTDKQKNKMWQTITYMKIANQLDLLITLDKGDESIKLLANYLDHRTRRYKQNRGKGMLRKCISMGDWQRNSSESQQEAGCD